MKRKTNKKDEIFVITLNDIQKTNQLFLELLYDLSKYPRSEIPKKYIRAGLFAFEEQFVLQSKKIKK